MKERPILFSAPMVRANRAGLKTQTRRIVRPYPSAPLPTDGGWRFTGLDEHGFGGLTKDHGGLGFSVVPLPRCPYGVPGDRLWVREAWARLLREDHLKPSELVDHWAWYWADPQTCNTGCAGAAGKVRPSIHMPHWACRNVYEITEVRVQRLQDISEEDAKAEGPLFAIDEEQTVLFPGLTDERNVGCGACRGDPRGIVELCHTELRGKGRPFACWYATLWDSINGDRGPWSSNPWVWAISYRPVSA